MCDAPVVSATVSRKGGRARCRLTLATLIGALLVGGVPLLAAAPTVADRELLVAADLQAGAPAAFRARVEVVPLQPGRAGVELDLWRQDAQALLRFRDARHRGKAFLQRTDGAWFLTAGARPVKLSPAHRFAGGVSLQEILGLAYSRDYEIADVRRQGAVVTFDLRAKTAGVAYPRVTYVVDAGARRPLRIELRLASGRIARLVELTAWAPGRRLSPAELVVKDLVTRQPPVRVRFRELVEDTPPAHLFDLGTAGDAARAAL